MNKALSDMPEYEDLCRTSKQLTALLDSMAEGFNSFVLLQESAKFSLLCLADDLAYQIESKLHDKSFGS